MNGQVHARRDMVAPAVSRVNPAGSGEVLSLRLAAIKPARKTAAPNEA